MPDDLSDATPDAIAREDEQQQSDAEREWRRRRREAVFGEGPPVSTSDDRDDHEPPVDSDAWLRAQVPPHHGG